MASALNKDNFIKFVLNNPLITLITSILFSIIVLIGIILHFKFETNYRVFFSETNPDLVAFEKIETQYGQTDNVIFAIHTPKSTIFENDNLKLIQDLTERAWTLPAARRVDSLSNYQHSISEEDDLIIEELIYGDPNNLSDADKQNIKDIIHAEPLIQKRLLSDDYKVTTIAVILTLDRNNSKAVLEIASAARELRDHFLEQYPDVDIKLSGTAFLNIAFIESSLKDNATLVPLMYLFILLTSYFFLRSIASVFSILIIIILSTAVAMGFGGWAGLPMTTITMVTPTIVITLAVADCIHIAECYAMLRSQNYSKYDALAEALSRNALPIFLTSITTACGFLTLLLSDTPPFGHMGMMVAAGVMAAWIFSITAFPALLMLLPSRQYYGDQDNLSDQALLKRALLKCADLAMHYRKVLLPSIIILTASGAFMTTKVDLNDRFVQYFDQSIEFRRDTDFLNQHLAGMYYIDISLPAKHANGVSDPEYLENIDKLTQWLRSQNAVLNVYSISDIFKRLNKNMHGDDQAYHKLPDQSDLSAQYLLLYEMSLPIGLDLTDRITIDKSASRMTAYLKDMPTSDIRAFKAETDQFIKDNLPKYMHAHGTSNIIMFANISQRNIEGMLWGVFISLSVITISMFLSLRDIKLSLIALIPNMIPLALSYGLWTVMVGEINMAFAIVSAVSIGIIQDDTVHFLIKFRHGLKEKMLPVREIYSLCFFNSRTCTHIYNIYIGCWLWNVPFLFLHSEFNNGCINMPCHYHCTIS